ncbi:hypothetical protein E0W41_12350 [Neisseria meningitidis]|nr:hypothetical protein [Neisseria meningitidis]
MHPYGNLHHVIPTKVGIQFLEFQSFPINCLSIECLDSRLRGNDGRAVSVFSDKFLKLKISSFLQKQKTKIRNLKSRHSHEPTSRHSHESGNPESLKLQLTFEYCCCSKV